jgi:hypothetical protein
MRFLTYRVSVYRVLNVLWQCTWCDVHARRMTQEANASRGALNSVSGSLKPAKPHRHASTGTYSAQNSAYSQIAAGKHKGGSKRPPSADDPLYDIGRSAGRFTSSSNRIQTMGQKQNQQGQWGVAPAKHSLLAEDRNTYAKRRQRAAGNARFGGAVGSSGPDLDSIASGCAVDDSGVVTPYTEAVASSKCDHTYSHNSTTQNQHASDFKH